MYIAVLYRVRAGLNPWPQATQAMILALHQEGYPAWAQHALPGLPQYWLFIYEGTSKSTPHVTNGFSTCTIQTEGLLKNSGWERLSTVLASSNMSSLYYIKCNVFYVQVEQRIRVWTRMELLGECAGECNSAGDIQYVNNNDLYLPVFFPYWVFKIFVLSVTEWHKHRKVEGEIIIDMTLFLLL